MLRFPALGEFLESLFIRGPPTGQRMETSIGGIRT